MQTQTHTPHAAIPAQPDLDYVPLSKIRVLPEFNPRKRFNDQDTIDFADRIARSGWLSPLLVRPDGEGGYILVAGERRFRAVSHLGWTYVPATIREMDDVEHKRLALGENVDRRELTIAEEALVARDHVDGYEGDHEAAANALGWPVKQLRHRLRLLHATPEVMQALLEEKIQLGHAELLAAVPAETQAKALPRIMEGSLGVNQVRDMLNGFASPLAKAIFDTADCANCPFNSECQSSLFATHVSAGLCTNRACYSDKTQQALVAKREALREEFASVALRSEKTAGTTVALLKFGEMGVGEVQFDACRSCQFRGAVVNDAPGPACGSVDSPVCFNVTCNRQMREAYQASLAPPPSADDAQEDEEAGSMGGHGVMPAKAMAAGKSTVKGKGKGKGKGKPQPKATQKSVISQLAGIPRRATVAAIQTEAKWPLVFSTFALLQLVSSDVPGLGLVGVCKALGVEFTRSGADIHKKHNNELLLSLHDLDADVLYGIQLRASVLLVEHEPDGSVFHNKLNRRGLNAAIASRSHDDLSPFVVVDEAYLNAHTRPAIDAELEQSGFKAWMEAKPEGAKAYAALSSVKKDECITKVMEAGFDFTGYVPATLASEMKDWLAYAKE